MSSSSMHPVRGARSPQARRAQEFAPTDQTGEALIAMLQEVSRVSRDNDHRLVDSPSSAECKISTTQRAEATDLLKDLSAGFRRYATFLRAGDPPYARSLACGKSGSLCCGPP